MEATTKRMRRIAYFANFLFSFTGAITIYANSSFIEQKVGLTLVGVLYAISAITSMGMLAFSGSLLARIGNRMFFLLYGAIYTAALFLLIIPIHPHILIGAFILYLSSANVLLFSLNVFFAHLTPRIGRGNMRGVYLLLGNVGVMLGPLVVPFFIDRAGFIGMYVAAIAGFAVIAILIQAGLTKYKDAMYVPHPVYTALRHTIKEKTLRNVVAANFILQFFYAWMVVYTPIYLAVHLGFSWDTIGIIFTIMLTTFVILDYPLGRIADYLKSEKELTAVGFIIMAGSVFTLAFASAPSALVVGIILFCSRVGAATVEAMTEIHFYKIAKDSDPGLLSLFCDLRPLAYITAPLLAAFSLTLLPFQSIFIVLGIILILGFSVSLYMEKKQAWWVEAHKE